MDEWNGERACTMIALQRTLRAMEDGELKAILWHQGCSDAEKWRMSSHICLSSSTVMSKAVSLPKAATRQYFLKMTGITAVMLLTDSCRLTDICKRVYECCLRPEWF